MSFLHHFEPIPDAGARRAEADGFRVDRALCPHRDMGPGNGGPADQVRRHQNELRFREAARCSGRSPSWFGKRVTGNLRSNRRVDEKKYTSRQPGQAQGRDRRRRARRREMQTRSPPAHRHGDISMREAQGRSHSTIASKVPDELSSSRGQERPRVRHRVRSPQSRAIAVIANRDPRSHAAFRHGPDAFSGRTRR